MYKDENKGGKWWDYLATSTPSKPQEPPSEPKIRTKSTKRHKNALIKTKQNNPAYHITTPPKILYNRKYKRLIVYNYVYNYMDKIVENYVDNYIVNQSSPLNPPSLPTTKHQK